MSCLSGDVRQHRLQVRRALALLIETDHDHVVVMPDADADARRVETIEFAQQLGRLLDSVEDRDGRAQDGIGAIEQLETDRGVVVVRRDDPTRVLDVGDGVLLQPRDHLGVELRRAFRVSLEVCTERIDTDVHVTT